MSATKKRNTSLIILAFIMLINALSAGIIVPLLYPYSAKFGINPLGLSFLFASYSFFQFLATPVIGRLADKFGRKPMLLLSIFGTSLSLALFASAQSVFMLFVSRSLDGITGGNISVAQAMIADTTTGKDRAKGFGILGAMFGLGFLIGPAIGGFMSNISLAAPFWFASFLALIATVLGAVILKETLIENKEIIQNKKVSKQKTEPLFNLKALASALVSPTIGFALFLTFLSYFAHQAVIIAFQAYTVDDLKLDSQSIGMIFASIGLMLVFIRSIGLKLIIDKVKSSKKIISTSFLLSAVALFLLPFFPGLLPFLFFIFLYIMTYSLINPVVTSIISKRVKEEDQGVALGINQSYASLGQIFGPISAGFISKFSINLIFIWGALLLFVGFLLSKFTKGSSRRIDL